MIDLLNQQASTRGDAVALRSKHRGLWQSLTWSGLQTRVAAVAAGLNGIGVGSGDTVAVLGENTAEWIIGDLAVQALGGRSLALPPQTPSAAVVRILRDSGAVAVLAGDQEHVDLVLEAGDTLDGVRHVVVTDPTGTSRYGDGRLITLAELEAGGAASAGALDAAAAERATVTVFTAGATGDPRAVDRPASAMADLARTAASWLELGPDDRSMSILPLATPAARVLDLYAALVTGAELTLPESPATVAVDLLEAEPTVLCVSPRALELLRSNSARRARESSRLRRRTYERGLRKLDARLDKSPESRSITGAGKGGGFARFAIGRPVRAKLGLRRTRRIVVTGGPVPTGDLRFFWALGIPALATYGQADVGGLALAHTGLDDAGAAGAPLPGVETRTTDAGELEVRSPVTGDAWEPTGDLVRTDDDGRLLIRGRRQELLDVGGVEVVAGAVEAVLCQSDYIRRALVDADGRGGLVALVEVDPDTTALWAADKEVHFSTYGSLVSAKEVRALLADEVQAASGRMPQVTITRHVLLPRLLNASAGELTATLALRRHAVAEAFRDQLSGATPQA